MFGNNGVAKEVDASTTEIVNLVEIYQNFSASCTSKSGTLLGESEICIPKKYSYTIGYAPTPEKGDKNEIEIEMTNIQIIEIDDKLRQMSLIMHLNVEWSDNRVELVRPYAILSDHDQKRIWSPKFVIATNLVSQIKNGLEEDAILYGFQKENWPSISHGFSHSNFRATVFCEMNFSLFPFDMQICEFKVCINSQHNLSKFFGFLKYTFSDGRKRMQKM